MTRASQKSGVRATGPPLNRRRPPSKARQARPAERPAARQAPKSQSRPAAFLEAGPLPARLDAQTKGAERIRLRAV